MSSTDLKAMNLWFAYIDWGESNMEEQAMSIRNEFMVHVLNTEGMARARRLARLFSAALDEIEEVCGTEGRAMAMVRTKLQEASFFAKRALAERPLNQEGGS